MDQTGATDGYLDGWKGCTPITPDFTRLRQAARALPSPAAASTTRVQTAPAATASEAGQAIQVAPDAATPFAAADQALMGRER